MSGMTLLLIDHLRRPDEPGRGRRAYCRVPLNPWLMLSRPEDFGQFAPLWLPCPACLFHLGRHARFLAAQQSQVQPAPEGSSTPVITSPEASHV